MTPFSPTCLIRILALLAIAIPALAEEDTREGGLTGTGIYGYTTQKGQLVVNGLRIAHEGAMMIADPIGAITLDALDVGNVVALHVNPTETDWTASYIERIYATIGPIQTIAGNRVTIMGTEVVVPDADLATLKPGDWVAVSGFWNENGISSKRIDKVEPQELAHMTGTYFAYSPDGIPRFGTSELVGLAMDDLAQGAVVSVTGHPIATGMQVVSQSEGLFEDNVRYILAKGYLSSPKDDGFYTLIGSGLIAFDADTETPMPVTPVVTCGFDGFLFEPDIAGLSEADRAHLRRLGC
jgi:hypothetical protein